MIREFMKSDSKRDFAIITTADDKFQAQLEDRLHYKKISVLSLWERYMTRNYLKNQGKCLCLFSWTYCRRD